MNQRTLQAIRHVGFEDLGSFEVPLRKAGYEIEYVDVTERDVGAMDPYAADLLVVLGGPVGVYDHQAYPVISEEVCLLQARLAANQPTLGICLGAQIMAAALDAQVYPGRAQEIGWSALRLEPQRGHHPLAALQDVPVLHWHGDTFDLPTGCTRLASTHVCENQAFSRGTNILALQFHAEVRASRFEHWLWGHANELTTSGIAPSMLRREAHRHAYELENSGATMLAEWLEGLER